MARTRTNDDGTVSINRIDSFVEALDGEQIENIANFEDFLLKIEDLVAREYPGVSRNALNNARGDWYESLIVLGANEYVRERESAFGLVRLPNINSFSCENLYGAEIAELIADLRNVLADEADVSLISSNPDFVVVDASLYECRDASAGTADDLEYLNEIYQSLAGECDFESIVGYCSVKSGLRPDRRLQIAHEGSLMKALYRHIQTRLWAISAPGIRYFGIAGKVKNADREALKTVATHSIVDVLGQPESAVDELFEVNSGQELIAALDVILT